MSICRAVVWREGSIDWAGATASSCWHQYGTRVAGGLSRRRAEPSSLELFLAGAVVAGWFADFRADFHRVYRARGSGEVIIAANDISRKWRFIQVN